MSDQGIPFTELQRWRWVAIAPLLGLAGALAVAYTAVVAAAEHVGGLDDGGDR